MKTFVIVAAVAAMAGVAAPAFAQTLTSPQAYAGIGYTGLNPDGHDVGEITGRGGLRFSPYWGVEGEVGTSVGYDRYTDANGGKVKVGEQPSAAGYVVGYYPVTPKFDLLARVGYGDTALKYVTADGLNHYNASQNVSYGAGAQYFLDGKNGIRVDYTRRDFQASSAPRDMDTWAVGYVHKF